MKMKNLIITHKKQEGITLDLNLLEDIKYLDQIIGKRVIGYEITQNNEGLSVLTIKTEEVKEIEKPVALTKGKGIGKSQYRGVYWDKSTNKWRAMIQANGKRKSVGRFHSEVEAAVAYDNANYQLNGFKGWFNFPETFEYLHKKGVK